MKQDQKKEKVVLVRIDKVIGYLYLPGTGSKSAVIHAKGGPSLGDMGESPLWPIAKKYGYILFIPDYIGYCRSYGDFNFKNCVQTIHEAEAFLRGHVGGLITDTNDKIQLDCSNIVLVGSSWGGAIVPFLEKFQKSKIQHIALVKPVTNWQSQGKTKYKETDIVETSNFTKLGWENIYRGYKNSEWPEIFAGKRKEFNPLDNIGLLKNKSVYISHGKDDKSVNWRKSFNFYNKLKSKYPKMKVYWKLMKEGHSGKMNALGLEFMLKKSDKITSSCNLN